MNIYDKTFKYYFSNLLHLIIKFKNVDNISIKMFILQIKEKLIIYLNKLKLLPPL